MSQFARPSADTTLGHYTDQAGGIVNIYTTINEVVADDALYILSPYAPVSEVYVTKLTTTLIDPFSSVNHFVRYRYSKSAVGEQLIDLTVELRQAYVSESSLGTLIRSDTYTNISNTPLTQVVTLTGAQADAITDYTNLYLRFIAAKE